MLDGVNAVKVHLGSIYSRMADGRKDLSEM